MKCRTTTKISLRYITDDDATYDIVNGWSGDAFLIKFLSPLRIEDMTGYSADPLMSYAEWLVSQINGLKITKTEYETHEYPDDTIF